VELSGHRAFGPSGMVSGKPKNDILFWFELKTQNNWKSFGLKPKIIGSLLENQKRFEAEIKTKRARNLNSALHGGAQPVPKLWHVLIGESSLFLFLDTSWLTISYFRITRYCEHGKIADAEKQHHPPLYGGHKIMASTTGPHR
jgi:hypothetical protein